MRRARIAVLVYFALLGLANGVWLARIPAIKHGLQLTDGVLGLALLSGPVGLVVVVLLASRIVHRVGSRRATLIAGTCTAVLPVGLGLAPNLPALMVALFAFGLAAGMCDVAMNSQAVLVERAAGRPLMTSFHACYSFGGLVGALLGALFATAGISPAVNFTTVGVPLAVAGALAGRWLVADLDGNRAATATAAGKDAAARGWRGLLASWTPGLIVMALLAVCSLLGEGAAEGWSAVFLHDNVGTSAGFAALGYAGFSVAMAAGRLSGDRLNARFGATTLMRSCGLIAAAGLALGLLGDDAALTIIGFTAFGAGLSCTFPLLLSAAGNVEPARPAHGIARVAGAGYAGMLAGPPIIGGLANTIGLRWALVLPLVLSVAIAAGAGVTSRS
ncbi:MAG: MFS transporter [Actinobacteria bacterium]|nr:MFS transporter [Actinomycetota bacterium]